MYGKRIACLAFSPITRTIVGCTLVVLSLAAAAAVHPVARITMEISNTDRVPVQGTQSRFARAADDIGSVPTTRRLHDMAIVFRRSSAQQAALQALIAAQQDPSSSLYHRWLTPGEFAARFGVATADLTKVKQWLVQQGFSIEGVARSRNRVSFSGTAAQIKAAFGASLHYYRTGGRVHFAPSGPLSVPVALSPVVQTVTNLSDFRPRPRIADMTSRRSRARPHFTSSQTGNHFLTPGDVATIYDITPAYNAGYNGAGQSIAVVGQSAIALSDIENFQRAAGLPIQDPTLMLVPNSGSPTVSTGDESESDLDIEYAGAIAPGAIIDYVYVGGNSNDSVWDALVYAVQNRIAPIISVTYGLCETNLSAAQFSARNGILEQAAAQGQSVVAAAGDVGSTDCYGEKGLTSAQQRALAVDFPASSQYVTGMGGTEFSAADTTAGNSSYWKPATNGDVVSSALSYIPEQVWNDDSPSFGMGAGGGGVSSLVARPAWQTGVPGIPSGGQRLVPDISLDASSLNAGYLYCSSDSSIGISGSCSNGFRDSNDQYLTVTGGTSVAAPIFAGMLAIINDKLNSSGQGVVNPILYSLAADPGTYATAFHDITNGGNQCAAGTTACSTAGESDYPATVGYDEASGLGSVDFYNLLTAWPAAATPQSTAHITLSAADATPAPGENDAITVTVSPDSGAGTPVPTGTLTIVVDGVTQSAPLTLSNGSASYDFSSTKLGSHAIKVIYSGDATYVTARSTLTLTVTPRTFSVASTNVTVAAGSTGTSVITITPQNGFTGTIAWTVTSSPALTNGCFSLPNTNVTGGGPATATLTVYTQASSCSNSALAAPVRRISAPGARTTARRDDPGAPWNDQDSILLAVISLLGLLGLQRGRFAAASRFASLIALTVAVAGCSGSGGAPAKAATGTYTVTIAGTDTANSAKSATTSMTLTVD